MCREKEQMRLQAEREARVRELEAERQRQEAYKAAVERESARVNRVLEKNDLKEQSLEVTYTARAHDNARQALARQLELDLKRKKVRGPATPPFCAQPEKRFTTPATLK